MIDTNTAPNDFAPATQGQLKWIATNAFVEMETNLPGGAGIYVRELVGGFSTSNNFSPVNLGQLKCTATSFYDRLIAEGYTNSYPWTATTTDDVDFAPANLGQVKNVFSFDLGFDTDGDGMPDWWEKKWGLSETNPADAQEDLDSDGAANLVEYYYKMDPTDIDTDNDGMRDGWEFLYDLNPLTNDAASDNDGDGLSNAEEYAGGTYPNNPDSDNDFISDGPSDPDDAGPILPGSDPNPLTKAPGQLPAYLMMPDSEGPASAILRLGEDMEGRPIVAWCGENAAGSRRIYVMKWFGVVPATAGEWGALNGLWEGFGSSAEDDGMTGKTNAVTALDLRIDRNGWPVVFWSDIYPRCVNLRRWNGSNWVDAGGVTNAQVCVATNEFPWNGAEPCLALTSNDRPVVAYLRNNTNLHLKAWNGTQWAGMDGTSAYSVVAAHTDNILWVSVEVGAASRPFVSYALNLTGGTNIFVRRWNGTNTWTLLPGAWDTNYVYQPEMLVDAEGDPHVSWYHILDPLALHVCEYDATNSIWTGYGGSGLGTGLLLTNTYASFISGQVLWNQTNGAAGVVWIQNFTSIYMKVWNVGGGCWTSVGKSVTGCGINTGGREVEWACATPSKGTPVVACAESVGGGAYSLVVRQYLVDTDGDGLSDAFEQANGLNQSNADSDNDGLSDGDEWLYYGTIATNSDSDADSLTDGQEILGTGRGYPSNPLDNDTDDDGILDGSDLFLNSAYADQDGDGIPDSLDNDADNDGLTNGFENAVSCPYVLNADSDGDGFLDGQEYYFNTNYPCDFNLKPTDTSPPVIYILEPVEGATL